MFDSQFTYYELSNALRGARGDVYRGVLKPWLEKAYGEIRWLSEFSPGTPNDWSLRSKDDSARMYAVSRISQILLLQFQTGDFDRTPWTGAGLTVKEYCAFFEQLGMSVESRATFHPFFYEIVGVEASPEPSDPIEVIELLWPTLMLRDMVFSRGGVRVRCGERALCPSVATTSKVYWAFRRRNRPCEDESHGWGSNSQWRTSFRRDVQIDGVYYYNAGATVPHDVALTQSGLSESEAIELVRYRSFVSAGDHNEDVWPYGLSHAEPSIAA